MDSRTTNSAKNILFSEIAYIMILVLQFVNRSFFIRLLPQEYLGMNGLFLNILSFLSLAELGIGSAINFTLYKPLKEKDIETLKSIMALYRRLYITIGLIVFASGSVLAPFLPHLIKEPPEHMQHMYLYFILYLTNSGITYFYTYKRSLIICDQKEYIISITTALSQIILKLLQILILILFQSYTLYLSIMIVTSILENLVISIIANKMYPYLKEKTIKKLNPDTTKEIKKNVYALVFQKIGEIIVYATDNIIISKFVGFSSVGIYSNYTLVIHAVETAAYRFFDAITASIGNLVITDEKEHVENILYRILFINAWMFHFCSVSLLCLLQPFIRLWIGSDYLMSNATLLIIVINFYLTGMRATIVTFKRAIGLFWQLRYKPVIEGLLNLVFSIPLAVHFGVAGTLLGTIISTFCMSFIFESYSLFQHYFKKGFWKFVLQQTKYAAITIGTACITLCGCSLVRLHPLIGFVIQICLCLLIPNLCMILLFRNNDNYIYFKKSIIQFAKLSKSIFSRH